MIAFRAALLPCLAAATLLTSGCTGLPRGAALRSEISRQANQEDAGFAFYPVTRALLPTVDTWPAVNVERSAGWPKAGGGAAGQVIAAGDMVDLKVWDNEPNSLITGIEQRAAPLGEMTVSPAGRIFVPYVGEVRIAGMSPERARAAVEAELTSIAPSAQVQLSVEAGRANTVDLVSGVSRPGNYPMPDREWSVLSLISAGGGIPAQLRNPRVKLQRGGTLYAASVDMLYENPSMDAVLRGGDKVIVEEDQRYFLSLGAAGREDIFYFTRDYMTALEAVSMVGGIADNRADPQGILVLREYPAAALVAGTRGPREERVIFAIDLTTPDGLFSARKLQIYPGDVVLATESPVSDVQTALAIAGSGFGVVRSYNLAKDG